MNKSANKGSGPNADDQEDESSADDSIVIFVIIGGACIVLGSVAAIAVHCNRKSGTDAEVRVQAQGK